MVAAGGAVPARAERIVTHYRRMVGFFGLKLLAQLGVIAAGGEAARIWPHSAKLVTLAMLLVIAMTIAMLYQGVRLALAVGTLGAELCVVGLFAPGLGRFAALAAHRLSSDPAIQTTVAAVVPGLASVIGLLCLLRLSAIATRECRAAGISVGLLGPRRPEPPRG